MRGKEGRKEGRKEGGTRTRHEGPHVLDKLAAVLSVDPLSGGREPRAVERIVGRH